MFADEIMTVGDVGGYKMMVILLIA